MNDKKCRDCIYYDVVECPADNYSESYCNAYDHSDSHLISLTKPQIIKLLRIAEHNFFVTEEKLNNSVKAGMEIAEKYDKAKELLKAAVATFNDSSCDKDCCQCKWNNGGCEMSCRFAWIHTDEALKLIGG